MTEKVFPADDASLADAIAFVEGELEKADCSMRVMMQITVCVEEMFVNVAHYAYGGETGAVRLSVECDPDEFSLTITDSGIPFDPLAKPDPDITLTADERQIGGLGIFMVKKSMDSVAYARRDGRNVFTMTKKLR